VEKANLQDLLVKYNRLSSDGSAKLEEIENGKFPWKAELHTVEGMSRMFQKAH